MLSQNEIVVTITDTVVKESSKNITIYAVRIEMNGHKYLCLKRYHEFLNFNVKLKIAVLKESDIKEYKLPNKKLFHAFNKVNIRKSVLKEYIFKLLSNYRIAENELVRQFFNLPLKLEPPERTSDKLEKGETTVPQGNSNRIESGPAEYVVDDYDDDDEAYHSISSKADRYSTSNSALSLDPNFGIVERKGSKPGDFEFLKVLGKGSFGKVLLARQKQEGYLYAVKIINKCLVLDMSEARHVMAERNVLLQTAKHPFLVSLKYSFQTKTRLYLVLDYVSGGELFFHLQREKYFSEEKARFYAAEIASGLGFLHSLNIMYRDLKPENILIDSQGHVALTDFGLSKENIHEKSSHPTYCGTPEYLPPEVIRKLSYDKTVDWWALGSILFEMLFGLPAFYDKRLPVMFENICRQELKIPKNQPVSKPTKDILMGLLEKNKNKRLGKVNDFDEIKQHTFFKSIDWTMLNNKQITPPFLPILKHNLDLQNFDINFTKEPITPSLIDFNRCETRFANSIDDDDVFLGFSYVPSFQSQTTAL